MLTYRKTRNVSVDELNGETGVDRGVGRGHGRDEGARVVGSGACVGRSQTCVGAGGLDTEEGLLTLGDVDCDGESVENEREEDQGACLPAGYHDGGGYTMLEAGVSSFSSFDSAQEPRMPIHGLGHRCRSASDPGPPEVPSQNSWGMSRLARTHNRTSVDTTLSGP